VHIDDVSIQKKVLESLADPMLEDGPPKYLQDDIIDACIHMLRDKNKNDIRAHGKVFIETTMICQLLHKAACSFYPIRGKEIKDHKKYGMQYLKHDMIFLPINQNGNHWYLAVVNTKKQEIQVLDSLGKQLREREELKYTVFIAFLMFTTLCFKNHFTIGCCNSLNKLSNASSLRAMTFKPVAGWITKLHLGRSDK